MKEYAGLWAVLAVLAVLTPVGLYGPEMLKAGAAWGEWGIEEIGSMIGYVPRGMKRTAEAWEAPMPGYAPAGQENAPLSRRSAYYVVSALTGIVLCGAGGWLLARRLGRRKGGRSRR